MTNQTLGARLRPYSLIIALGLIIIWGANFTVQKYIFKSISPNGILLVRYGLVMPLCSVALLFYVYGTNWPRLSKPDTWNLLKLGIVAHLFHIGLVTHGMNLSTPFSSSVIIACGPIFTLVLLRWMTSEKMQAASLMGVLIAMIGVLIFMSEKLFSASWSASGGDLILLLAAACFSYYTVASKPLIERLGSITMFTYTTLLACPSVVIFATLGGGWQVEWAQVPVQAWLGLLYGVVLGAFCGWLIWGWVNSVRGVARSAPLSYLMALVAGVISWLSGGEVFSAAKVLGAIIALAGVAYAQFAAHDSRLQTAAGE